MKIFFKPVGRYLGPYGGHLLAGPEYMTDGAAGADLYSHADLTLEPGETYAVPCGFALELPWGYQAEVRGRSGLFRNGIVVHTGTIDCDYRGEVHAMVMNAGRAEYRILSRDRIAQLVIYRVERCSFEPTDVLSTTARGSGGMGSTGR